MDALEFAQRGIEELTARMNQIGNITFSSSENYGKTPEEVVAKFFSDQGLTFQNMDVSKVLSLVSFKKASPPPISTPPVDVAPDTNV